MKFRNGYVSNSSSSSFIVSLGTMPELSLGDKSVPLNKFVPMRNFWGDKESLIEAVWDNYVCYTEDGNTKEEMCVLEVGWFETALKELESGKTIFEFSMDYNDETAYNIMRMLDKKHILCENG